MNPSRSGSLKNGFSLEYLTHYCISCRNQMKALAATTEQIGFTQKCTNHDILLGLSFEAFLWLLFWLFSPCVQAAVLKIHCPWIQPGVRKGWYPCLGLQTRHRADSKASCESYRGVGSGRCSRLPFIYPGPFSDSVSPPFIQIFVVVFSTQDFCVTDLASLGTSSID